MSSFPGLIEGYPEVAVDLFMGKCLEASFFFLSHLHTDHMRGLRSRALQEALKALPEPRLFCSRQSAALLASWRDFGQLRPYLCPLEVGEPRQLTDRLLVTLLPAGHCPGSVMLLFEAGGGTVLYTGDFRMGAAELRGLAPLHDAAGRPKQLDLLYVDTTFCTPGRRDLPDRQRSADRVVQLVCEWLARDPRHRANLVCHARYGYEHVFSRLREATGQPVHVSPDKLALYERLPEIAACLTPRPHETRVHSCPPYSSCLLEVGEGSLRTVKLSTLYFFIDQSVDTMVLQVGAAQDYRVLYSFHASLRQVEEMVRYLRPARVVPCVEPVGGSIRFRGPRGAGPFASIDGSR
ncbi:protein artemis-like [Pollicipes pollicipes]|uniref:protein artemis-like n=1 Tax=Pollicipes pollicipes TaxID=41117 RepID=UPI0018849AA4|nr:protein artemis-like [Pollicipes pollicipes]